MYVIRKSFSFAASHFLNGLPAEHPCSRMHGHNYTVTVELRSVALNETGFVKDYRELQPIKDFINDRLDHRHLNEVMFPMQPSAEIIARYLFDTFRTMGLHQLVAVEVQETEKTMARYEEPERQ